MDNNDVNIKALTEAAEQGDSKSQYELGKCYLLGKGVPASPDNEATAFSWYKKAAKPRDDGSVNDEAVCRLGDCHYFGIGAVRSIEEARSWYKKAAELGNDEAIYKLKVQF